MGELTGFLAVLLIFGTPLLCTIAYFIYKANERRQQLDIQARQSQDYAADARFAALQSELAQLRDTSTQHAVSLQHALERMEQRMEHVERRVFNTADVQSEQPAKQIVGR